MGADWNLESTWTIAYGLPMRVRVDMRNVYADAPAPGELTSNWKWVSRLMELDPTLARPSPHYRPYYYLKRAKWIIQRLEAQGLNESHRVLIVGSGFGMLIHAFRHAKDYGFASVNFPLVWGIDGSNYVSQRFDNSNDGATTVFRTFESKNAVKNALINLSGDWQFKVVISEQVLESLELSELSTFANDCEAVLDSTVYKRIIHVVNPLQENKDNLGMYQRSLDEWQALRSTHTFVSVVDGDYRLGGA